MLSAQAIFLLELCQVSAKKLRLEETEGSEDFFLRENDIFPLN